MNKKVILAVVFLLVLTLAIGGGVYYGVKKQQDIRSKAAGTCPAADGGGDPSQPLPTNFSKKVSQTTTFGWDFPASYGDNPPVTVKLYSCSDGTDSCVVATSTTGAAKSRNIADFNITTLDPNKQYWWRVVLAPPAGCDAHYTSNVWTFTTGSGTDVVAQTAVFQPGFNAYTQVVNTKGLMVYHTFVDQASCQKVQSSTAKCNAYASNTQKIADPDCIAYWVLYPGLVCPASSKWGGDGRSACENINLITTNNYSNGSYLMMEAVPPCSAAQFDPDNTVYQTGSMEINCNGCPTPPQPGGTCQRVTSNKDLTTVQLGDTVTFTGYGTLSNQDATDSIDLIKFNIASTSGQLLSQDVPTTLDSSGVWKATLDFKITDPSQYSVTIQAHWKSKNQWLQ